MRNIFDFLPEGSIPEPVRQTPEEKVKWLREAAARRRLSMTDPLRATMPIIDRPTSLGSRAVIKQTPEEKTRWRREAAQHRRDSMTDPFRTMMSIIDRPTSLGSAKRTPGFTSADAERVC